MYAHLLFPLVLSDNLAMLVFFILGIFAILTFWYIQRRKEEGSSTSTKHTIVVPRSALVSPQASQGAKEILNDLSPSSEPSLFVETKEHFVLSNHHEPPPSLRSGATSFAPPPLPSNLNAEDQFSSETFQHQAQTASSPQTSEGLSYLWLASLTPPTLLSPLKLVSTSAESSPSPLKEPNMPKQEGVYLLVDASKCSQGELASQIVFQSIKKQAEAGHLYPLLFNESNLPLRASRVASSVKQATIDLTNELGSENDAALCSVAILEFSLPQRRMYYANKGNASLFRFRKNKLEPLEFLLGTEIQDLPKIQTPTEVQLLLSSIEESDLYLLCSSALAEMVPIELMDFILTEYPDIEQAAQELITMARSNGGTTDLHALLIRVEKEAE